MTEHRVGGDDSLSRAVAAMRGRARSRVVARMAIAKGALALHRGCGGIISGDFATGKTTCGRCMATVDHVSQFRMVSLRGPEVCSVADGFRIDSFVRRSLTAPEKAQAREAGWVQMPNGDRGYVMFAEDDCLRAAVATALQAPDAPGFDFDRRRAAGEDPAALDREKWGAMTDFAALHGLSILRHRKRPPVRLRRWIGVLYRPGMGYSHALVMEHDRVIFDPAALLGDAGLRLVGYRAWSLIEGYSFKTTGGSN